MRGCEAIVVELPGYVGGKLDASAAMSVQRHLKSCDVCQSELREVERLEELLAIGLPSIKPSPGFASSFANRLAQEVLDDAAEQRFSPRALLGWFAQPWLLPVGAVAVLALIMANIYGPGIGVDQSSTWSLRAPAANGGVAVAPKKPARDTELAAKLPDKAEKKDLAAAKPPADLVERPELFVDYAIIRDLDVIESDRAG